MGRPHVQLGIQLYHVTPLPNQDVSK